MKIEVGKTYETKDGRKAGPLQFVPGSIASHLCGTVTDDERQRVWRADGQHDFGDHRLDLIAEWSDGPVRTETVTRKVIVPGNYVRLRVSYPEVLPKHVSVAFCLRDAPGSAISIAALDAPELRAAAATFIELADALEQQP